MRIQDGLHVIGRRYEDEEFWSQPETHRFLEAVVQVLQVVVDLLVGHPQSAVGISDDGQRQWSWHLTGQFVKFPVGPVVVDEQQNGGGEQQEEDHCRAFRVDREDSLRKRQIN